MKKTKMINSELSYTISKMGHTDSLTIGDCGLPIPDEVKRIDLALTHNVPTFIQTLDVVLEELCVEEVVIAEEILDKNMAVYEEILKRFENIKITKVSHEEFKKLTKDSKAVVRTGECSPYANIILKSGVVF
ncbi:MAG: D-ribose pyranase [Romboutsia timonensis]|uniref:D-ribose pyranase n=1 Tax=Romboutsia timonensis TaxID=1776391 RepID=UPI0039905378